MKRVSLLAGLFALALSASSSSFAFAPCPQGTTGTFPNCVPIQTGPTSTGPTSVPEPGTLALLGLGVAGAIFAGRRKNKDKKRDK